MKQFIKHSTLFLVVFFLLDKLFLPFILLSPNCEVDKRLEQVLKGSLTKDLIVMGASTGARDIIASQLEDSLHLPSYNLSYPGASINFQEFILRMLIKHGEAPNMILLTVDPSIFISSPLLSIRYDRLYPLVKYNDINDELIELGEKNALSRCFVLARINKSNFDLRRKKVTPIDTLLPCGSMPISFQRKDRDFHFTQSKDLHYDVLKEDPDKLRAFRQFQETCLKEHIQLILIFPPYFNAFDKAFEKRLKTQIIPGTGYYCYDTLNPVYIDKSYYYDEKHLLTKGAVVFTNELSEFLRKQLKH